MNPFKIIGFCCVTCTISLFISCFVVIYTNWASLVDNAGAVTLRQKQLTVRHQVNLTWLTSIIFFISQSGMLNRRRHI